MTDDSGSAPDERRIRSGKSPTWAEKFAVAWRGVRIAFTGEVSFVAHFVITGIVLVVGVALGISRLEWCLVVLCIMAGLSSELLNTSIEHIARATTQEYDPHIRDALDIASAAVLIISIGAAILAVLVLGNACWEKFM